jgi:GTP diphosphokinase / guanosine-3',5'-bis(diphosphate) 3'-diphosphatase
MLRQYELVEKVRSYDPGADEELLNRAYIFSMMAHGSQLRASGDPYFSHPIEVAGILTDLKLDTETIVTAILHDTIEDTVASFEDIDRLFGERIARLVDGVTKLSKIEIQTENERAAENFRKFLLAMSDDIRVLLVKLADRLHNMRTLHHIKNPEKRQRIARETMDIYAPLAERIGMYPIKDELQEIAFRELRVEAATLMADKLSELRNKTGNLVPQIVRDLDQIMQKAGIRAEISGREKRPFSIWKKMQERKIAFEQLSDVIAFRVVVDERADIYRALGEIHLHWPFVPGRFKDYVSTPKRNGYQSLHTTVMGSNSARIEIQIRDSAMHSKAELGVAAHWSYKQGAQPETDDYHWLQNLIEILEHQHEADEFLEHTKLEMYQDQVFCFTPKGALIPLPRGSTVVDFAYAVHTKVGDTCVGAKINGRPVPLRTIVKNGDQIEVLRSTNQTPQAAWEGFVITGKARSAIRRYLKNREREEYKLLGQQMLDAVLARLDVEVSDKAIDAALARLKLADRDALRVALVRHELDEDALIEAIMPGGGTSQPSKRKRKMPAVRGSGQLTLKGLTPGVAVHLAPCCQPVAGDRIIAVRKEGGGFDVHTIDCLSLQQLEDQADQWVDVAWLPEGERPDVFTARVTVVVQNKPGSLAAVTQVLARAEANISNLRMSQREALFHTFVIDVEVADLAHLTNIIAALRAARVVSSAERDGH